MEQIKRLLTDLNWRQRITLLAVAAAVLGGLYGLTRWTHERDFKPLYTSLSQEDAGAVVAHLGDSGIEYRVADGGGTILVPSAQVAETRLRLATAGLPKTGRIGFELFDRNNFGATEFAEQINYHRALEGELERSVSALAEVERARVHITLPKNSVFLESRRPAKASVLLKLRPGVKLPGQNVVAITHLVASAVEGLTPEAVSVLDYQGNLLSRPRKSNVTEGAEPSEAQLEYRQSLERDLLAKIHSTLEPVLGPERYRATVLVDCDFTSGEQSEETFDPTRSVMLTSQRTEDVAAGSSAAGVPGTGSNLPRPTARPATGTNGLARRTENVTYQSSRTVRRLRLPQGNIKRLSVSLLVDHDVRWEGTGESARRVVEVPAPEKLKSIRDLVSAAAGLQTERGDTLILESLPFESTLTWEPPAPTAGPAPGSQPSLPLPAWLVDAFGQRNLMVAAAAGAGLLLLLLVTAGWLVLRKKEIRAPGATIETGHELPPGTSPAPPGMSMEDQIQERLAEQLALKGQQEREALSSLSLTTVTTKKAEVLAKHIADEAKKNPVAIAQLVQTWVLEK